MAEISVQKLNKYFGDFHLLKDISFDIFEGQRVGIVGANGAGKTTLFKILTGEIDYDDGFLYRAPKKIGILDQLPSYPPLMTVRQVLWQAFDEVEKVRERLTELEKLMEFAHTRDIMDEYQKLTERFELLDGYNLEVLYNKMTNGLDIPKDMQDRPFMSLSGGEKTRVNLAKTMLMGTEILLLDEPTNHLDLQSIQWLESYLSSFKGAAVIISHDRYFLDKTTNVTIELENGTNRVYNGCYSQYMEQKEKELEQLEEAIKRQEKEIGRLEYTLARMKGWGLGSSKMMKKATAMEKRIGRIERLESVKKAHRMKGKFNTANRTGDEVYYLDKLSVGFDRVLIDRLEALILRGERVAIMGDNGCGKTTLLKTILGMLEPISGKVIEGAGLKVGFLPQEIRFDHPERTVLDTLLYETNLSTAECRNRLAAYSFLGEDVFKEVSVLSGGEKTRLRLCLFMNDQINTLFLDEPTNHLDMASRQWLEDSLDEFTETMLFVSHDRYFINRFATRIWMVENGGIIDYVGTYDEFESFMERRRADLVPVSREIKVEKQAEAPKAEKVRKGLSYNEKKQLKDAENEAKKLERELDFFAKEEEKYATDYERLASIAEAKDAAEMRLLEVYEIIETLMAKENG